jgi:hypothetical protein
MPPAILGEEVDNPTWPGTRVILREEHFSELDSLLIAGILVGTETRREYLFEHQSDSLTHRADRTNLLRVLVVKWTLLYR